MKVFQYCIVLLFCLVFNGCREASYSSSDTIIMNDSAASFVALHDAGSVQEDWSKNNTVVFHITDEPDNLHPTNGRSLIRTIINFYTQKTLLKTDPEQLIYAPDIVEKMPEVSKDHLRYTYHLRKDLYWDDHSAVTAKDILFTFKANICALTNNPSVKPYLENLDDLVIDPIDSFSFTMKMKTPSIYNEAISIGIPILQANFFDSNHVLDCFSLRELRNSGERMDISERLKNWASVFNDARYGSDVQYLKGLGDYRIEAWEHGQSIVLSKKRKENPGPEKIIFKLTKDVNIQELEFKSQLYDVSLSLSNHTVKELMKNPDFTRNYHVAHLNKYSYSYLVMNMKPDGKNHKLIFNDKRVRKAIALLSPVDNIMEMLDMGSSAKRMTGSVYPSSKEYNHLLKPVPYDVKQAVALLDSAGWKDSDGDQWRDKIIDGKKTELAFTLLYRMGAPNAKDIVLMLAESYQKIGIHVQLQAMESGAVSAKAYHHDFDMILQNSNGSFFPEDFAQVWHYDSWLHNGSNYSGFGDSASDMLIDSIAKLLSTEERVKPVCELQKIIYDEQPCVFLFQNDMNVAVHRRFSLVKVFEEKPYLLINEWKLRNSIVGQERSSQK